MTKFLLSLHVLAVIVAIGPVTVAASMFPAAARRGETSLPTLHRICRVYAAVGIAVPLLGMWTASAMGVLGEPWVIVSMALTACAAVVLVLLVLPGQQRVLASAPPGSWLAAHTGVFNLLWATVTVLMIVRPGSTTGVS